MIETIPFQQEKAEAFGARLLSSFNAAATTAFVSIGYQTGLFEAMAVREPSTSEEIAAATGYSERYVREWLGGVVLSGIAEYDASSRRYSLPPEHAAFLTEAGGVNNMAPLGQILTLIGRTEGLVIDAFKTGVGVPYEAYEGFQSMMFSLSKPFIDGALVEAVIPQADGIIERLKEGIDVLELGCGQGHATNVLAAAFPNSRFTGIDLAEEGIEAARAEAAALGLKNVTFEAKDVEELGEARRFDFAFCLDVVHDLARPVPVLHATWASLKTGGVLLAVEPAASSRLEENLEHPVGAFNYAASLFHCMSVAIAQGGEGSGSMIGDERISQFLQEAGFSRPEVKHIEGDPMYTYHVGRK